MLKSQSAMEYLMTYGWAILIIAVVLGAIYSLGLFNGASLAPRSQPGSCQVFRPSGPRTTTYITLEGACTNLLPQYVGQFDGANGHVQLPLKTEPLYAHTFALWLNPSSWTNVANPGILGGYGLGAVNRGMDVAYNGGSIAYEVENGLVSASVTSISSSYIPLGAWTFLVVEWDGTANANALKLYVNGKFLSGGTGMVGPIVWNNATYPLNIGQNGAINNRIFQGQIANFQIYNASLDSNTILSLYQEGIGGPPVSLQNLTAWYPLNGNANDYSGNIYNGAPGSLVYTNQWLSGYTVP